MYHGEVGLPTILSYADTSARQYCGGVRILKACARSFFFMEDQKGIQGENYITTSHNATPVEK